MEFCPRCGRMMKLGLEFKGTEQRNISTCSCGFAKNFESKTIEENVPQKEKRSSEVVTEKHETRGFPHKCKKCGFGEAEVLELGVFYGDEAGVYLFKCKKCGYTERQSDGTGN